jgi:hypothetical protein
VPAQTTTKPDQTELRDRLGELERQHRQADDAIAAAKWSIEGIYARRQEIAVAVVAEDPDAVAEDERLEGALQQENRRIAAGREAWEQIKRGIAEAEERLAAEKRDEHLQRASVLARERHALEPFSKRMDSSEKGALSP